MNYETWAAFAVASAILLAMPGPTVLLVVSYALGHGWRAALPSVAGVALGDAVAMTASLAGLGAILLASAELYTAFKWMGAAYLVYLGVKLWRVRTAAGGLKVPPDLKRSDMLRNAFTVTVLNPKALVFFVAFVPQFLDPGRAFLPQATVMVATFVALACVNVLIYGAMAVRARRAIQQPSVQRIVNRVSGSLLITAGCATALSGRPA